MVPPDDRYQNLQSSISIQDYQQEMFNFLHMFCNYDIKTPVGNLMGIADVLLFDDSLSKESVEDINLIKGYAKHILRTLDTILAIIFIEREESEQKQNGLVDNAKLIEVDLKSILHRHDLQKC